MFPLNFFLEPRIKFVWETVWLCLLLRAMSHIYGLNSSTLGGRHTPIAYQLNFNQRVSFASWLRLRSDAKPRIQLHLQLIRTHFQYYSQVGWETVFSCSPVKIMIITYGLMGA